MMICKMIKFILPLLFIVVFVGCQQTQQVPTIKNVQTGEVISKAAFVVPASIDILPLTGFSDVTDDDKCKVNIYICLIDVFGDKMKAQGLLRFELYEKKKMSVEPKGKKLAMWPDFDLASPPTNKKYWQEYLRAYKFNLDLEMQPQECILVVTFVPVNKRRIFAEYTLKL